MIKNIHMERNVVCLSSKQNMSGI